MKCIKCGTKFEPQTPTEELTQTFCNKDFNIGNKCHCPSCKGEK